MPPFSIVVSPPQADLRALSMLWYIIPVIARKPAMNAGMKKQVWAIKSQIKPTMLGIIKVPSFTDL